MSSNSSAPAHPDREDLLRLLMLALYRCGRQTEALDAYRRTSSLRAELGLEPGPPLRRLERAILEHDPSLDLAEPTRAPPGAGAAPRRPRRPLLVAGLRWSPRLP